jgi:hypothetical protein
MTSKIALKIKKNEIMKIITNLLVLIPIKARAIYDINSSQIELRNFLNL